MPTSGFGVFSANVLTCLQISGIRIQKRFDKWQKKGIQLSQKFVDAIVLPSDVLHLLGNGLLYPISIYASFQLAEFFGTTVIPYKLEEFCHSPIFGIKDLHHVWILGQNEKPISSRLGRLGLGPSYIELQNSDKQTELFQSIFFIQSLMVVLAEKYGYKEKQFLAEKKILKTSSDLIYCV